MPRRTFLGLASAAVASCATPKSGVAVLSSAPSPSEEARWAAVRDAFSLSQDRVHLANLLIASNPRSVRDAIERWRVRLDEEPADTVMHDLRTGEYTNATLDSAALYLRAKRDQIALTDSTTTGLAIIYGGYRLAPGDELITTKHDHFVTHESLRLAAERTGAKVRSVTLYDDGAHARVETMVRAIESALTPATRIVAVTWVHSSTGVKIPVRGIAEVVKKANASRAPEERIALCVDGVHGFGVEDVTMEELACDFFAAGCHKWLFGPRGTGIVWARSDAWPRLRPIACPFHWEYVMARERGSPMPVADGRVLTPGGFRAFEHRWALGDAFRFHLDIGKESVAARTHELARQLKVGLSRMRHVTLHTPLETRLSSGIVCFEVAGMTPEMVIRRLHDANVVGTTTPYVPSYARLTPGITNTPEEIERTLAAVRALA